MKSDPTVLTIGATGGIGSEAANAFTRRGWRVRALHRRPAEARACLGELRTEWVQGDAINAPDVVSAAEGADFILHAVNPP